ncbi:MAG: class I SAM-dependent DNA methyltransferase [Halobacteriota archaeon]
MSTLRDVMDAVTDAGGDGPVYANLYADLAPLYDFERERMRDHDAIAEFVETHAPEAATSVAVGACGTGHLLSRLATRFDDVVGVDANTRMLELAAERTDAALVAADLGTFVVPQQFDVITVLGGSIAHLPAEIHDGQVDASTDAVTSMLENVYESLTPNGVFLCDFMQRGALESGAVSEVTFESDRYRVERTVITTGHERGVNDLGATGRYTFGYEITDTRNGETVRIGTSTSVREFGVPQLLGAMLNAGFDDVRLVTPPTHGKGIVARKSG